MANNLKCIKYKCDYYFESDIYIKCLIADKYIKNGNCIGITPAKKNSRRRNMQNI